MESERSLHFLLLEDSPADAALIKRALTREGLKHELRRVESEADYRSALDEEWPDIILSDLRLPTFDGLSAMRIAAKRAPHVPFLLVSGALEEELGVACLREGACDYILKDRLTRLGAAARAAIERKQVEAQSREQEQMLRLVAENVSDSIEVLDLGGRRLFVTRPHESSSNRASFHHALPEDRDRVWRAFRETVDSGEDRTFEFRLCGDGPERHMESHCSRVDDERGRPWRVLVVSRDITERRRAEEERLALQRSRFLLNDIERAREVQARLMSLPPTPPGLRIFAHLEASQGVGGDFYDLTSFLGDDSLWTAVIGDVTGKGMSAALTMAFILALFRGKAAGVSHSAAAILRDVNKRLHQMSAQGQPTLVSAAVVTLDLEQRVLRHARAGHEKPIFWRRRTGSTELLESAGLLLGASAEARYRERQVTFEPGDRLFCYTDGVTEARNARGEFFGRERLVNAIERTGAKALPDVGRSILKGIRAFENGTDPLDDRALLIVEV